MLTGYGYIKVLNEMTALSCTFMNSFCCVLLIQILETAEKVWIYRCVVPVLSLSLYQCCQEGSWDNNNNTVLSVDSWLLQNLLRSGPVDIRIVLVTSRVLLSQVQLMDTDGFTMCRCSCSILYRDCSCLVGNCSCFVVIFQI